MNLASTISIYAGGSGSGCKGSNCGRPLLHHLTDEKNLKKILRNGIKTEKTGAKALNKGWDKTRNAVYCFENKDDAPAIKGSLENALNPNNTPGSLGKKQVAIVFKPEGKVRVDPEYDDFDQPFSAKIHSGPVPAKNIVGYYKVTSSGKLHSFKKVR